ncbi:MAG: hypothetical protein VXW65_01855 [Pseudomonadota bacterium]|nr:hypothetical protein [Pseudomonadota bacterium]
MKFFWVILPTLFLILSSCSMGEYCPDYWDSGFYIENVSGKNIKTVKMEIIDLATRPEKTDLIGSLTIRAFQDNSGAVNYDAFFNTDYNIYLSKKYKITVNDNLFFLAYDFKKSDGFTRQGCTRSSYYLNRCRHGGASNLALDMKCGLNKEEFDVFLEELRSRPDSEKVGSADAD